MRRRELLGALGAAVSVGPGVATSETQDDGTCYDDENNREYTCYNNDRDSDGLDTYYVKTWTGDESYKVVEDDTTELRVTYNWYMYYGDPAIKGIIENNTTRDIPNAIVEIKHYADDEKTVVVSGYQELGTLKAGLEYEYGFYSPTNYAGDYSIFELWFRQW